MRSFGEIQFRLTQEAMNLYLLWAPPRVQVPAPAPLAALPAPGPIAALLSGSPWRDNLIMLADRICRGCIPLLGYEAEFPSPIAWRRDPHSGVESDLRYFRTLPYLDAAQVGDQKAIWELNRHHHLVVLAQAFLCTNDDRYLLEIVRQWESWQAANPFHRGMNWAAALEVAFRAFSWIWVYHLAGNRMEPSFARRFLESLHQHGCHLEWNLSVYSSPNTHLLGEAAALHALGALFPQFPRAAKWKAQGAAAVQGHMETHVRPDGTYFEQTSYYHLYALDFFLFHALLEPVPDSYRGKLARMAEYVAALQGRSRLLPFLGDDDGGRLFHPYGARNGFGRASVATAALFLGHSGLEYEAGDRYEQALWWLGAPRLSAGAPCQSSPPRPALFADAGVAVLAAGGIQVIVDAGPFGEGTAGHSHSDTLSVLVRHGGSEILVDAGTYTYLADTAARDWFRSTAAHNTIRIDGRDQATRSGTFRWIDRPRVEIAQCEPHYVDAAVSYGGFRHRRRVFLWEPGAAVVVLDEVSSADSAPHSLEQFWHWGPSTNGARLFSTLEESCETTTGGEHGWRSPAFGVRHQSPVTRILYQGPLPTVLGAWLDLAGAAPGRLDARPHRDGWMLSLGAPSGPAVWFPPQGAPQVQQGGAGPLA